MKLASRAQNQPDTPERWARGEPLWQRVPLRNAAGRPYIDFMMFAPRLNRRPRQELESVAILLRGVLSQYENQVVFAELNLRINVLWVSLENRPGLIAELVAAVRLKLPEFHLVGHNPLSGG